MNVDIHKAPVERTIAFYGGSWGAILPFIIFISGVITIALSGAPDERGFWPILLLALGAGLFLAKDRNPKEVLKNSFDCVDVSTMVNISVSQT